MRIFISLLFILLSLSVSAQFSLFSKSKRHRDPASSKAARRVVKDHRDAFSGKSKKGPNVKTVRGRKRSWFSSKKKRYTQDHRRKTKKKGGFRAKKSNYKAIKKTSGDAFSRNPRKSSRGGGSRRGGGRRGKKK